MDETMMSRTQRIDPDPAERYRGTFAPEASELSIGDPLPPGWEALYFPFSSPLQGLGTDGTPQDDVLPPISLPRRMYAGEDTIFHQPIRLGDTVERRVRAGKITEKRGKSGRLVFADIERHYFVADQLVLESVWHDVFLEDNTRSALGKAPVAPLLHSKTLRLDTRHLFRFSAITFNTHRVHYDRRWAQDVEGLQDLLVQGPLTRMLLLDSLLQKDTMTNRKRATPRNCRFTAIAPLFVDREVTISLSSDSQPSVATALDENGHIAARAVIDW